MEPDKTYNEWYFQADYDLDTIIRFLESCLKEEGLDNASIAVFGSALTNTMGSDFDIDMIPE